MESNHKKSDNKRSVSDKKQKLRTDEESEFYDETLRKENAIAQSSGKSPKTLPTDLLKNSAKGLDDGEIAKLMMLDLLHRPERKNTNRVGMLNCLFVSMVFILVFSFIAISWITNYVNSGLISETALTEVATNLSEEERTDLDEQLRNFDNAVRDYENSSDRESFKMVLTSDQANHLIESLEKQNKKYTRLRIYPADEKARILVSIPLGGNKYMNAVMEGRPRIENGEFDIMLDYFKIGKLNKSDVMRERMLNRLRREITEVPAEMGLPFVIHNMTIRDSKIYLELNINRRVD
jgi:hypothetical protein